MRLFIEKILDTLFPPSCLGCRAKNSPLCEACISKINTGPLVTHENVIALFPYRTALVQQALWRLKYRQKKQLATILGRYLYRELIEELGEEAPWRPGEASPWLLIPIPGSKKRISHKGYNQAAELAKAVRAEDRGNALEYRDDLLIKIRETPSQVSMKNRGERLSNIEGSFGVSSLEAVRGRACVVVDDITTTGATMKEAGRVLTEAGARKIILIAVAA